MPVEGQAVHISSAMWIVLDITPPKLGAMVIDGKLTLAPQLSLHMQVMSLKLWGIFEIGTVEEPYDGDFQLDIYGFKGQSPPITMIEAVFLSSKVIGGHTIHSIHTIHTMQAIHTIHTLPTIHIVFRYRMIHS